MNSMPCLLNRLALLGAYERPALVTAELGGCDARVRILRPTLHPEFESELPRLPQLSEARAAWQRQLLLPLAFTGGLASLGIEFAAARLLAPFFGQSVFIWGPLVGLILIYLTVGYYAGGRLADRRPDARLLFQLTAAAALLTAAIPVVSRPILSLAQTGFANLSVGLVLGSLLSVIILFAAPVILLGMVSPFVRRLRIRQLEPAGNAAGAVYALSTLGSILGTFIPVFWLIPTCGTRPTIFILAFALGTISAAGLLGGGRRRLYLLLPVLIAVLAVFGGGSIRAAAYGVRLYETESAYNYIQVVKVGNETQLVLNEGQAVHSVYNPTSEYTHAYWDEVLLARYFGSGQTPKRVAVVGLAGGTIARELTAIEGPVSIDGVGLDAKIVDVGRKDFAMTEPNPPVTVAEGRYWMAPQAGKYDLILVDAYRHPHFRFSPPTTEFSTTAHHHLAPP